MAYDVTAIEVFIASPGDVTEERQIVRDELQVWNATYVRTSKVVLLPVGWETHSAPELGGRPQQMINDRLLEHADILVGLFWTRLGSPTGVAASGTVEEIQKHHAAGKPVMLYFSDQPVVAGSYDVDQFAKLQEFKTWARGEGLTQSFSSPSTFRDLFRTQLPRVLIENAYLKAAVQRELSDVEQPAPNEGNLSQDALELLLAAAAGGGDIVRMAYLGGRVITAGGRNFTEGTDPRSVARWEAAIQELSEAGLVENLGGKGQIFQVTHRGYHVVDTQPSSSAGTG